jgi:hypothetical protein
MKQRLVAGGAALVVVVGLVALAVVGAGGDGPRPLPIGAGGAAPEAEAMVADMAMAPTEYRVAGDLPELDGEERAWSVDRDVDEARILELAAALGIAGEVEAHEHGWRVVDDAGGDMLDVGRQPGLPWSTSPTDDGSLSNEPGGPDTAASSGDLVDPPAGDGAAEEEQVDCPMPECPPGTACSQVCPDDGSGIVDPGEEPHPMPEPMPLPEPERPEGLPSEAEAEAIGREVLAAAGLDLGAADVSTDDLFSGWFVSARPQVGSLPVVGMDWGVTVGVDGVVEYANGWLSDLEEGDAYPLIGTTAAVERLRAGQGGEGEARPEPAIACVDCPDAEPSVVTITGARVGLQLVHASDVDEAWLVPTYLLATDGGEGGVTNELWVLALGDENITEPPAPELPEGCELIGGDALVCEDDGGGEIEPGSGGGVSGEPGVVEAEPGAVEGGEPQQVDPAEPTE